MAIGISIVAAVLALVKQALINMSLFSTQDTPPYEGEVGDNIYNVWVGTFIWDSATESFMNFIEWASSIVLLVYFAYYVLINPSIDTLDITLAIGIIVMVLFTLP